MKVRSILLTGDDGYDSMGTRLLLHFLRDKYDVTIIATNSQQSAVGGKMSLGKGFHWGRATVDGVKAYWVDGTPVDAVELANALFFETLFDLTISGINWGANLGSAISCSGTFNAALHAISIGITKKAIAMSWDLPPEYYIMKHNAQDSLEKYLTYPGAVLEPLLEKIIEHNFWDTKLLNINFPQHATSQVRFTKLIADARDIYTFDDNILEVENKKNGQFTYRGQRIYNPELDSDYDVKAVTDGVISVSPCRYDFLHDKSYKKMKKSSFTL